MIIGDADVSGVNVGGGVAEDAPQSFVAFVRSKVVAKHLMVVGVEHGNSANVRVFLQMHGEIEHDVIDFRQISTA